MNNTEIARVFKAFCDERRIEILNLLLDGERCACKLLEELDISQPTLSHHMKILCESGIVTTRREGKWTHYCIDQAGSQHAKELLEKITECRNTSETKDCC
jgi:ArsR family transcriptional regulator